MSCRASSSARHRPTGPAPTTMTGSEADIAAALSLRDDVLHRTGPALVGQVEHEAGRRLVLRLVEGVRRGRAAGKIFAAGVDHLLFGFIEIVDPHAEVIEAELLVAFFLQQRDVEDAVRHIDAASGGAR